MTSLAHEKARFTLLYYQLNKQQQEANMKQLFRRIFFWDESAKGAHFGLTLFFVVPWIILSILYLVFCPLFFHAQQKNPALWLMMVVSGIGVLSLIYSVFLLIHILIVNRHGLLKKLP